MDMVMLIPLMFGVRLQNSTKCFIKRLGEAIGPGMIDGGISPINLVFCNKPMEFLRLERQSIVRDNTVRNSEPVNDMLLKEVDNILSFHFSERDGFDPSCEEIGCHHN